MKWTHTHTCLSVLSGACSILDTLVSVSLCDVIMPIVCLNQRQWQKTTSVLYYDDAALPGCTFRFLVKRRRQVKKWTLSFWPHNRIGQSFDCHRPGYSLEQPRRYWAAVNSSSISCCDLASYFLYSNNYLVLFLIHKYLGFFQPHVGILVTD